MAKSRYSNLLYFEKEVPLNTSSAPDLFNIDSKEEIVAQEYNAFQNGRIILT